MKLLIKAEKISVEFVGREVLDIDGLEIYDYDRIGLVGANGVGKSTLLKVLLGELSLAENKINRFGRFRYIPQREEIGFQEIKDYELVGKLGVNNLTQETMSGGEETRLKIAQALMEEAHGIFADEPTCHLDSEGIDFLINKLKAFSGALIIISHDRYFLDKTVDKIWELKDGKITEYFGNYSDYIYQKGEEYEEQVKKYEQFTIEHGKMKKAAEQKRNQAHKISKKTKGSPMKNNSQMGGRLSHQKPTGSKEKKLYSAAKTIEHRCEMLEEVKPPEKIRNIKFRQSKALELHNPYPIRGEEVSKSFGERILFNKASFSIPLGMKVAFTGGNGVGKTTLFEMILNKEDNIYLSPKAVIGNFSQNSYKSYEDIGILDFIKRNCDYEVSEIYSVIASMGFSKNDMGKELNVLSGGEIVKLMLAKMLLGNYNILLMDEPSNFLDLPSIEALETLMKNYKGTILFISHDKRLLSNVADIVYEIQDYKIVRIR